MRYSACGGDAARPDGSRPDIAQSRHSGLAGVMIPDRYNGMELDLPSLMIVAEVLSRDGSYGVWQSVQNGIGVMPLLMFGTEEQKQRTCRGWQLQIGRRICPN